MHVSNTYIQIIEYRYIHNYSYRRCSAESSHSKSHLLATLQSLAKFNKGIKEYEDPTLFRLHIPLGK